MQSCRHCWSSFPLHSPVSPHPDREALHTSSSNATVRRRCRASGVCHVAGACCPLHCLVDCTVLRHAHKHHNTCAASNIALCAPWKVQCLRTLNSDSASSGERASSLRCCTHRLALKASGKSAVGQSHPAGALTQSCSSCWCKGKLLGRCKSHACTIYTHRWGTKISELQMNVVHIYSMSMHAVLDVHRPQLRRR